jgi:hypothetical protein
MNMVGKQYNRLDLERPFDLHFFYCIPEAITCQLIREYRLPPLCNQSEEILTTLNIPAKIFWHESSCNKYSGLENRTCEDILTWILL